MFRKDFNPKNRIIKQEIMKINGKKLFVSTVDLGIDHNFIPGNQPLYYETMIFDWTQGKDYGDLYCNRYPTRSEAEKGHKLVVERLKNGQYAMDEYGHFEFT